MQDKECDVTGLKCSTKFQALKHTYKGIVDYHNDMSLTKLINEIKEEKMDNLSEKFFESFLFLFYYFNKNLYSSLSSAY
ncbi:hypothetical protein ACFW04_001287 [Cataglyphis niger]